MAACADGKAASDETASFVPSEGLVEEPATAVSRLRERSFRITEYPTGGSSGPRRYSSFTIAAPLRKRDSSGTEILGQHGAVPGANVGTVRAQGGRVALALE